MRTTGWLLVLLGLMGGLWPAAAQLHVSTDTGRALPSTAPPSGLDGAGALFYVAGGAATLHNVPRGEAPVRRLPLRTPLTRLSCGKKRCRVRTDAGREGYVAADALSNVWLRVSKSRRRLYVYRGATRAQTVRADMAYNSFADKQRNGSQGRPDHWRTPEGIFYVVHKNPRSRFYKALVLNYPKVEDARRGLNNGLISRAQYKAIEQAQEEHRMPPMNTPLGGWIEIHGDGTGDATAWTQGCVAVPNSVMDRLWPQVRVGTPVLVE
jgi:hypothetical protein